MVETFGSGVAWIDYDNDGYPDLYFVNGAPGTANALYRNNRDGTFTDVTAQGRRRGRREQVAARRGRRRRLRQRRAIRISTSPRSGRTSCFATTATARSRTSRPRPASPGRPPSGAPAPPFSTSIATAISISTSSTTWTSRRRTIPTAAAQGRLPDVLPSDDVRRNGRPALSQQRERHVHGRVEGGGNRQPRRQGARRRDLRLRPRRRSGHLHRQRHGAELPLQQQRRRHLPRRRLCAPASATTSTASRRRAWAWTAPTSTATATRTSSSPISPKS